MPITERVRDILDRRGARFDNDPDGYFFGNELGEGYKTNWAIRDRWVAAMKVLRAEGRGEDLRFHDLRGEAASRLADMGVPVPVIQRFLGHSTLVMTQRYLRPRVGELDEVVDALDRYVNTAAARRAHGAHTISTTVVDFRPKTEALG